MANHILRCPDCQSYGLEERCGCGAKRTTPKPAKYSPEDRYGAYRRAAKKSKGHQDERRMDDNRQ